MMRVYCELHALGHAHSVEVWQAGQLVGGLYGVSVGGFFAGESMYHRVRDASKVALVMLVAHLKARGFGLFDVQQATDHVVRMGATETRPFAASSPACGKRLDGRSRLAATSIFPLLPDLACGHAYAYVGRFVACSVGDTGLSPQSGIQRALQNAAREIAASRGAVLMPDGSPTVHRLCSREFNRHSDARGQFRTSVQERELRCYSTTVSLIDAGTNDPCAGT